MFLAVVTGSFLFLIPWIAYLSASLPNHHEVDQWRFAWVGFDVALVVAIGVTALCAWRRLQIFIPWAIATATLLCCDAWFDIVLDWNGSDLVGAVVTAVAAELPLAALLLYVARRMIRLTVISAWRREGRTGPVPPLSRLSLVVFMQETEAEERRMDGGARAGDGLAGGHGSHRVDGFEEEFGEEFGDRFDDGSAQEFGDGFGDGIDGEFGGRFSDDGSSRSHRPHTETESPSHDRRRPPRRSA